MIARAARLYGASPAHLVAHVLLFLVAFWALSHALDFRGARNFATWFVAAIVLHDLVLLPAYSAADRGLQAICARVPERLPSPINHIRLPAAVSGVLLLAFFPAILARNETTFANVAGYTPSGYGARWAIVSAALFALSAAAYAVRAGRSPGASRRDR